MKETPSRLAGDTYSQPAVAEAPSLIKEVPASFSASSRLDGVVDDAHAAAAELALDAAAGELRADRVAGDHDGRRLARIERR
jgi:hypothetical protein